MAKPLILSSSDSEVQELRARLNEAEETLEAIRIGAVDALVVRNDDAQQIFTLKSADYTYRMLIESMDQGALKVDYDGIILYSNQQFSTLLGVSLEHIIGAKLQSFIWYEDLPIMQEMMKESQKAKTNIEVKLQSEAKGMTDVLISATPLLSDKSLSTMCVVVTDMTERNKAQEVKDEFISLASHQLRTPATGVKQYIHLVLDGYFGPVNKAQAEALQKANASNEREIQVINDLLKVAQIDAGKVVPHRQSTDIFPIIKSIVNEQTVRCQAKGQTVTFKSSKLVIEAIVDPVLIRTAIENIIDNASKYTPEGKAIKVSLKTTKNNVVINVRDEGVGISSDDIPKLFRKFSRIPNKLSVKVGGNGLGLYWVKKVIDLHQGKIKVQSKDGAGTEFKIVLPLSQ